MKRLFLIAVSLALTTNALAKEKWIPYKNDALAFSMQYPADWAVSAKGKAVLFKSPYGAAMGLLRLEGVTPEEAIAQRPQDKPIHPQQSAARFANQPALKIMGTNPKAPGDQILQYFVQQPTRTYFIQFHAPRAQWEAVSPMFNGIIHSFTFLTDTADTNELLKALE